MAPLLFRNRFRVPSTRLRNWDYRWPGAYAVTICVQGRVSCLGEVVETDVALSPYGVITAEEWLAIPSKHPQVLLDEWIVMPDHVHGILIFQGEGQTMPVEVGLLPGSLGVVVGQFKQRASKRVRARRRPEFSWQERFFRSNPKGRRGPGTLPRLHPRKSQPVASARWQSGAGLILTRRPQTIVGPPDVG